MRKLLALLLLVASFFPPTGHGQTPPPVVHAILFYSPTCPHCHQVITQYLIPLQTQYGNRLVLMGFDTSQQFANNLYWEAIRHYKLPEEEWVVPIMVVGEEVLIGGIEIPGQFPSILEAGLEGDGIDLPDFPPLIDLLRREGMLDTRYPNRRIALQSSQAEEEPPAQTDPSPAQDTSVAEDTATVDTAQVGDPAARPDTMPGAAREPAAAEPMPVDTAASPVTGLPTVDTAVGETTRETTSPTGESPTQGTPVSPQTPPGETAGGKPGEAQVPLGMEEAVQELESRTMLDRFNQDRTGNSLSVLVLLGMLASLVLVGYPPRAKHAAWPEWIMPVLVVVGAGVAVYLSYIEITQAEATCGPVGDCNTVNQSQYATLFGFLPVGVLGLFGYAVILVLWLHGRSAAPGARIRAALGLWAAALFGTLFSAYLTFLEPFVIGATCMWCLTSAVVMTLLLWYAAPRARAVWAEAGATE